MGVKWCREAEEVECARLYREGFLQKELAAHFNRSLCTIGAMLRRQNVEPRGQVPAYVPTPEEIEARTAEIRRGIGLPPSEFKKEYKE